MALHTDLERHFLADVPAVLHCEDGHVRRVVRSSVDAARPNLHKQLEQHGGDFERDLPILGATADCETWCRISHLQQCIKLVVTVSASGAHRLPSGR